LIDASSDYEATRNGRIEIPFDLKKSEFSKASGALIAAASERVAMDHLGLLLARVRAHAADICEEIHAVDLGRANGPRLVMLMEEREEFFSDLREAEALAKAYKVGAKEVARCRQEFEWALRDLQETMEQYSMDDTYSDQGDVRGFLEESYEFRPEP